MACVDEAHAVEISSVGPVILRSMEMLLAPADDMVRTMVSGCARALRV